MNEIWLVRFGSGNHFEAYTTQEAANRRAFELNRQDMDNMWWVHRWVPAVAMEWAEEQSA